MYRVLIILLLAMYGCGFQEQENNISFSFSLDVNQIERMAASSSSLNSSSAALSSNTAHAITNNDMLMFFGVVVRKVDGPVVDGAGNPLGQVVPGASRLFSIWSAPEAFMELATSGIVTIPTYVPSPSTLSVTFYGVLITEDQNSDGPQAFTSFYHVGGPYVVEGAGQTITVKPDMNILEDDHAAFSPWAGIFAKSDGTPVANTDITLEHCKIGFQFNQSMFAGQFEMEDQFAFHTNSKGMIDSFAIQDVDWKIMTGDGVELKPCGSPTFTGPNYGPSNEISFYSFIGATEYVSPSSFVTALGANASTYFADTAVASYGMDHDGDGLPTDSEIAYTDGNPFIADSMFHVNYSGGDFANVYNTTYDPAGSPSPTIGMSVYKNSSNVTGSCSSGGTARYYNGTSWTTASGSFADDGSGCTITDLRIPTGLPTNQNTKYVYEINPSYSADTNGDGANESLIFHPVVNFCQGTACTTPATISSFKLYLRTWGNGPADVATEVTNYTTLNPYSSCTGDSGGSGYEYLVEMSGSNFTPGGVAFMSVNSDCSTEDKTMSIRYGDSSKVQMYVHTDGNYTTPYYYVCYENAINSSTYVTAPHQVRFVYDASNACVSEVTNFDMTSQTGTISTISHFHLGMDNQMGGLSLRLNFSGGKYMCIDGDVSELTSGYCGDTNNATLVGNNFGSDHGTYSLQSVDAYQTTGCSGSALNATVQSASSFTFSPITVTSLDFNYGGGVDESLLSGSSQVFYPALGLSVDMNDTVDSIKYVFDGSREFCVEVPGGYTFYTSFTGTQFNPVTGISAGFTGGGTLSVQDIYLYGVGDTTCSGTAIQSINVGGSYTTSLNPPPLNVTRLILNDDYNRNNLNNSEVGMPEINIGSAFATDINSVGYFFTGGVNSFCLNRNGTPIFATGVITFMGSTMHPVSDITGTFSIGSSYTVDYLVFYTGTACDGGTDVATSTSEPAGPHLTITAPAPP